MISDRVLRASSAIPSNCVGSCSGGVGHGFVAQDVQSDRYRLGLAAVVTGRAAGGQHGLHEVDAILVPLASWVAATVSFSVRSDRGAVALAGPFPPRDAAERSSSNHAGTDQVVRLR